MPHAGGLRAGGAELTAGHRLPAKYIIHAVGPVWEGGDKDEDALTYGRPTD